jgi:hypothetical protein
VFVLPLKRNPGVRLQHSSVTASSTVNQVRLLFVWATNGRLIWSRRLISLVTNGPVDTPACPDTTQWCGIDAHKI